MTSTSAIMEEEYLESSFFVMKNFKKSLITKLLQVDLKVMHLLNTY